MANLKLKVLKSKSFTANNTEHTHYTCAYKGRVFGVNSMRFEERDFTVEDNILTLIIDVEVMKHPHTDQITGKSTVYLDIVPKVDLALAEF